MWFIPYSKIYWKSDAIYNTPHWNLQITIKKIPPDTPKIFLTSINLTESTPWPSLSVKICPSLYGHADTIILVKNLLNQKSDTTFINPTFDDY